MPFLALIYIDDHTADGVRRSGQMTGEMAASGKIVGLFRYPERKDIGHAPGCKSHAWSRDPGGWMCCSECRRRNGKIRQFLRNALFDFLGGNTLPDAPPAFRTPEGYIESFADND